MNNEITLEQKRKLNTLATEKVRAIPDMIDVYDFFIHPYNDRNLTEVEIDYLIEVIQKILWRPILPPQYISLKTENKCNSNK